MEFDKRLERAISRGQQARDAQGRQAAQQALTEEEYRNLHSAGRLELSEHIEACLRKLADFFPGFDCTPLVSPEGWGARVHRDDLLGKGPGGMNRFYSRLELLVRAYSPTHILELTARGTIRNKEVLSRNHYQFLDQLDLVSYRDLVDQWVLEYAEKFAARG